MCSRSRKPFSSGVIDYESDDMRIPALFEVKNHALQADIRLVWGINESPATRTCHLCADIVDLFTEVL